MSSWKLIIFEEKDKWYKQYEKASERLRKIQNKHKKFKQAHQLNRQNGQRIQTEDSQRKKDNWPTCICKDECPDGWIREIKIIPERDTIFHPAE